jgi:hypothetical protein
VAGWVTWTVAVPGTVIRWNPFTWFIKPKKASTTQTAAPRNAAATSPPPIQ